MPIDNSQWHAAIGCFHAFLNEQPHLIVQAVSFQCFCKSFEYTFFIWFILISVIILPFSVGAHFFLGKLVYLNLSLFSLSSLICSQSRMCSNFFTKYSIVQTLFQIKSKVIGYYCFICNNSQEFAVSLICTCFLYIGSFQECSN